MALNNIVQTHISSVYNDSEVILFHAVQFEVFAYASFRCMQRSVYTMLWLFVVGWNKCIWSAWDERRQGQKQKEGRTAERRWGGNEWRSERCKYNKSHISTDQFHSSINQSSWVINAIAHAHTLTNKAKSEHLKPIEFRMELNTADVVLQC